MKKEIIGLALTAAALAGCSDQTYTQPPTAVESAQIYNTGKVVQVALGESKFLETIDPSSDHGKALITSIPIVSYKHARGPQEDGAPLVNNTPTRLDVHVAVIGDGNLSNDAACETLRVDGKPKYIGAVALGGQDKGVFVTRPVDNPEFAYACSFRDFEPSGSNGIIIFTSETDR